MVLPIHIKYEECVTDDHTDDDDEEEEDSDYSYEELGVDNGEKKGEKDSYQIVEEDVKAGQLEKLKVEQCKIYLRKHGLRLAGNKETLIQRIREHLDATDGGGERKYPVSSFVVNCKGDACAGDVVLFEQNVFRIDSRRATAPPRGTRFVAGRILKESYGSEKQQHTFTIEVLWSTGEKPLPPLYPLLIKGRNLYRLNTMRRNWEDEAERQKVVSEKHARGDVSRANKDSREIMELKKKLRLLKRRVKKRAASKNIAMNPTEEQQPQNPPEKKPANTGNVQKKRHQHPERQPLASMDCNPPPEKHVAESKTRVHKKEKRKMMWQVKKPSSTNIAINSSENQPPEKKPNSLQSQHLDERHHHSPEKHVAGSKTRVQKKETRKMMWQVKKPSSTNIAINSSEEQPPEKKTNSLQSQHLDGRHHHSPAGKAKCEGQNTPNNSFNSVQRTYLNKSCKSPSFK